MVSDNNVLLKFIEYKIRYCSPGPRPNLDTINPPNGVDSGQAAERETDRQTDRQAGRQADRQTGRQTGRQTDRQGGR